jgi:putative addiction module component (TIGR02574 family)
MKSDRPRNGLSEYNLIKETVSMSQAAEELLQQALQLPEEERERIAQLLWRSIDEAHPNLHEEWVTEAKARAAEIDDGRVEALPGEEVRTALRSQLVR